MHSFFKSLQMAKGFDIKKTEDPNAFRYRIEEFHTVGWQQVATDLTKLQCQEQYDALIMDGVSPQRIKITRIE